jgi:O-antigen/teichoic acid export membrane protein
VNTLIMSACCVAMMVAMPILAVVYDRPVLIAPGLALCAIVPAYAAQFPIVIFERRFQWARVRTLQGIEPLAGFFIMIVLVILGFGFWGLVIGAVAGAWLAGIATLVLCPFPLRPRLASASVRTYLGFSWPVVVYSGAGLVVGYGVFIAGAHSLGLAGLGAMALAVNLSSLTDKADAVVTQTLYPAICAVQDRVDLLTESFMKSNRLTLMWGMPFGIGMVLFSADLVHFVLGSKWDSAIPLMQALGLIAASHHIAFNWDAFYRARGDSRPLAWAGYYIIATTLLLTVPLILAFGFIGFIIGMGLNQVGYLLLRGRLLKRLLPNLDFTRHVVRAIIPSLPAAALVVLVRLAEPRDRTFAIALAEVFLYSLVTIIVTWYVERDLLREVYSYVRRRRAPGDEPKPPGPSQLTVEPIAAT